MPSEVFSATVSTAALATPLKVKSFVSLPTIIDTAFLAEGKSFFANSSYTFILSTFKDFVARI